MELQKSLPDFERAGIAVFAVSYDAVDVLAAFAEKRGITYPLLSDVGSVAITRLGLLNQYVYEQHTRNGVTVRDHHYGVPYPGTFVLDQDGIVREKWFEQSYRTRPTAVSLLESAFAAESSREGVRDVVATDELTVTAWMGTATYFPYQKLQLKLGFELSPGMHVYGRPIPDGYVPLTVSVDPLEALEVGELTLPEPKPFRMQGLDDDFQVFEGVFRGRLPLSVLKNIGDLELTIRVRFQACDERACFLPKELVLRLPLFGQDNIRD